jgi:phosphatidylglycerophosphatase A
MSSEIAQTAEENHQSMDAISKLPASLEAASKLSLSSKEIITPRKRLRIGFKNARNRFALAVATCGIGYVPLMPGTTASAVTSLLYFFIALLETHLAEIFFQNGYAKTKIFAWLGIFNVLFFVFFCTLGIWAAGKATKIFKNKDPKEVVVDEVIGQFIAFMFIPLTTSWKIILLGFIMFRLFDISKPYPINRLQKLPAGIGVCADDILAGMYTGICLAFVHALMV